MSYLDVGYVNFSSIYGNLLLRIRNPYKTKYLLYVELSHDKKNNLTCLTIDP